MNPIKTLAIAALAAATLAATAASSHAFGRFPGHGPVVNQNNHFGPISCFACNLPRPHRPGYGYGPRWPRYGYWGHWYRWHPVYLGGGVPVAAAPAAAMPGPAAAAPQAPTGNCNCLTKQDLPNGGVLFADICTQQSAITPPQKMSAR